MEQHSILIQIQKIDIGFIYTNMDNFWWNPKYPYLTTKLKQIITDLFTLAIIYIEYSYNNIVNLKSIWCASVEVNIMFKFPTCNKFRGQSLTFGINNDLPRSFFYIVKRVTHEQASYEKYLRGKFSLWMIGQGGGGHL